MKGEFQGRAEVGRELSESWRGTLEFLGGLDRNVVLSLCLSTLSGLNDLNIDLRRQAPIKSEDSQAIVADYLDHWWTQTELLLLFAWVALPPSTFNPGEPPGMRLQLISGLRHDEIDEGRLLMTLNLEALGFSEDKDVIHPNAFSIAGKRGIFVAVATGAKGTPWEPFVRDWLKARELMGDTDRMFRVLKKGEDMWEDTAGFHHPRNPDTNSESVMAELRHLSYIRTGNQHAYKWATDLEKVGPRTIQAAPLGRGSLNRYLLRREADTMLRGFHALPKFDETFSAKMGMTLEEFWQVTHAIGMLGYSKRSCTFLGTPREFVKRIAKVSGFSKARVLAALRKFDDWGGRSPGRPILPLADQLWLTSFDWAASYRLRKIDTVFFEEYDLDLRGKVFEARCRKRLAEEGFHVFPDRVQFAFPEELVDAHLKVLGFVKTKTDFDVLAHRRGVLLLCECKEVKPGRRLRKRDIEYLEMRRAELDLISRWIAERKDHPSSVFRSEVLKGLRISSDPVATVLPIFLTNADLRLAVQGPHVIRYDQLSSLLTIVPNG